MIRHYGASIVQWARRVASAMLAPILLIALAGCSDAPCKEAEGSPPNPLLYEIANADGAVEGWMFGTIHALPTGTRWRTPALAAVINKADILLAEVAALDNRAGLAETFAQLSQSPGQPAIDQRVPGSLAPALADLMERGDLDTDSFAALETWAVALTLAQVGTDADPANGADRALIRDFAGRPVHELEGARAQLSIFDRLPEAQQRKLLAAVVAEADSANAKAGKLRRAWLTGDITALEEATRAGILADAQLRNALLLERNRDWVATIVPLLEDKSRPLIAVGAAHLVGAEGLAASLEARGYRVRRLP
jgi:hypothetical protein